MDFEHDPAAEFLSREREQLEGIINEEGETKFQVCMEERNQKVFNTRHLIFFLSLLMTHSDGIFSPLSNDDFELINTEIQQAVQDDLVDDLAGMSFSPAPQNEIPEKIRIFQENMKRSLEEKDSKEEANKKSLRIAAQKEMEDWIAKYNDTLEKTKNMNRNNEKDFAEADSDAEAKNIWEAVTKLCDFTSKGPKNAKDATRMRSIFLQMKTSAKS
jgi:hypothetical protein